MVKADGTSIYVFSAISRAGTATASYTINGMTGNVVATVVGENRSVTVTAGKFSDAFAANGVHIFKIDLSTATEPTRLTARAETPSGACTAHPPEARPAKAPSPFPT